MLRSLLVVGGLIGLPTIAGSSEPLQVEDRGQPGKLRFEGLAAFTSEQLADALESDVEFLLAGEPRAGFASMLRTLEERLVRGYQHAGFAHAKVSASWDEDAQRVVVRVTEGPRFRTGPVKIVGAQRADAQQLAAWITAKSLPEKPGGEKDKEEKDALQWKPGEGATFVPWMWKKFETRVKSGLAAQGFHFPSSLWRSIRMRRPNRPCCW